jgi:rhodanese-related sulfurtransferase
MTKYARLGRLYLYSRKPDIENFMTDGPIKHITPPEAWEILQTSPEAVLLDVRTSMEFEYVGHPMNAINIPWQEAPDWTVNLDFVEKVRKTLAARMGPEADIEALPILTICRSGKRSLTAAEILLKSGFRNVYNIEQGFEGDRDGAKHRSTINGWRHQNLPWEQS